VDTNTKVHTSTASKPEVGLGILVFVIFHFSVGGTVGWSHAPTPKGQTMPKINFGLCTFYREYFEPLPAYPLPAIVMR